MSKLRAHYHYTLRNLSLGPRYYKPHHLLSYLERRDLIARIGTVDAEGGRAEYQITEVGRSALDDFSR